jgi:hypothetical protein
LKEPGTPPRPSAAANTSTPAKQQISRYGIASKHTSRWQYKQSSVCGYAHALISVVNTSTAVDMAETASKP